MLCRIVCIPNIHSSVRKASHKLICVLSFVIVYWMTNELLPRSLAHRKSRSLLRGEPDRAEPICVFTITSSSIVDCLLYMSTRVFSLSHIWLTVQNIIVYIDTCIFFMFLIYISVTPNHSIKGSKALDELLATC